MEDFLKPIARASREMARGRKDETRFARAIEGLQRATGKATELGELSSGSGETRAPAPADASSAGADAGEAGAEQEVLLDPQTLRVDGRDIKLAFEVQHWETEQTPWDHLFDEKANELVATVNSNSLLFRRSKDEQFLGMLALADSVAAFLIERCSFDPDQARSIRDRWLHASLED
jgi:predicted nucleic acid-binding Zn ribbon protein